MTSFKPLVVQHRPIRLTIADAMREAIIKGELEPQQRLDEQSLATKFGVSRIPVREAFALLERDGLVWSEPRRGTFVVGLTDQDIHDIYEYRSIVEGHAVRVVAASADAHSLARLRSLVDRTEAAMHAYQADSMAFNDLEFHRLLVTLGGNKRSLQSWEMIADLVAVFLRINSSLFRELPTPAQPLEPYAHSKLISLIEAHEVDAAETHLWKHLERSEWVSRESIKRLRALRQTPHPPQPPQLT